MKKLSFCLMLAILCFACEKEVKDPTADFSFSGIMEPGETILFKNLSANCDSYSWSFGDGLTSSSQSPSHVFSKPGYYGVSLIVEGNGKSASANKSVKITGITYSIKNNTDVSLVDFATFTYDGVSVSEVEYFGTLAGGGLTRIVKTNRTTKYFAFRFQINGEVFFSSYPFVLQPDSHNDLVINNDTEVYGTGYGKGNLGLIQISN